MDIGQRLKHFRTINKLSGVAISKKINISQSNYSKYELNKLVIPTDILLSFCKAISISPAQFFNDTKDIILSEIEMQLIDNFRALDINDQYVVKTMTDLLNNRSNFTK